MARRILKIGALMFGTLALVAAWNYFSVHQPATNVISADPRNESVEVLVHYQWFVNPSVIVFDLRKVSLDTSPADVTRTLLQTAKALKAKKTEHIVLAHRGTPKFMLMGDYFQKVGAEYGVQNPVYTLRTLPENVYTLTGERAFPEWTGGMLGVVGKQLEDLNELHRQWFVSDLAGES